MRRSPLFWSLRSLRSNASSVMAWCARQAGEERRWKKKMDEPGSEVGEFGGGRDVGEFRFGPVGGVLGDGWIQYSQ